MMVGLYALDSALLDDVAKLMTKTIIQLERSVFLVKLYNTIGSFYLAEALEYIQSWNKAMPSNPTGICGPIEQLPLVALLVNSLELNLLNCHFLRMNEWVVGGKEIDKSHSLSFAKADSDLLLNLIRKDLRMPVENIHFPSVFGLSGFMDSFRQFTCMVIQGGQGEVKHWAFNNLPKRVAPYLEEPPTPEVYRKQSTRIMDMHPMTIIKNARTSGGGVVSNVPIQALSVGHVETWLSKRVSIWHAGLHDNQFGMRLTAFLISKVIMDSAVLMSLLADHSDVIFNCYRPGLGVCDAGMH